MACLLLHLPPALSRGALAKTGGRGGPFRPAVVARNAEPDMTAETLIRLLEEMMDLKLQQYAQTHLKLSPEVATFLQDKRETDRRRLDQIRLELVRFLES